MVTHFHISYLVKKLKDVYKRQAKTNAQIAQSVEQGTENPRVGGSIPPLGTRKCGGIA